MNQSRLEKTFSTVHLVYHRNKNQHGATAWWRWLSILRRSLLKLLQLQQQQHSAKNEKRRMMHISKYLHIHVIPKAYVAFSTVVADNQFSTLGTVLLAALAQTKRIVLPLPQPRPKHPEIHMLQSSSTAAKTDGTDDDFGTPIRRTAENDAAVEPPEINEEHAEPKKIKKSKTKKKKSANAIDDIFNALR